MAKRDSEESREKRFPISTIAEAGCDEIQKDMNELTNATNEVISAFKCEWDDQVKTSYRKYERQCQEYTVNIEEQVKKFKEACAAIHDIDVGELIDIVKIYCKAVEDSCRGC